MKGKAIYVAGSERSGDIKGESTPCESTEARPEKPGELSGIDVIRMHESESVNQPAGEGNRRGDEAAGRDNQAKEKNILCHDVIVPVLARWNPIGIDDAALAAITVESGESICNFSGQTKARLAPSLPASNFSGVSIA
jgi:hypothetical protein